jgi:hypothetical protein
MSKVKKYKWSVDSYDNNQLMRYEQGDFYIGDVDIEYVKVSKFPKDFNLTVEDLKKLDRGEDIILEKTITKKFIISKVND